MLRETTEAMDDLEPALADASTPDRNPPARDPFLVALGERVRAARARRAMTRRTLSQISEVSERHLANLELGVGNASVLVLRQVAQAVGCQLAELLGDETATSPEWLLIRDLLRGLALRPSRPARSAQAAHRADRTARRRQIHPGQAAGRRAGRALCGAEP